MTKPKLGLSLTHFEIEIIRNKIGTMINLNETKAISLLQTTYIQTFDFRFDPSECGKLATFLIKSIYKPEYSIMCDEYKEDFFNNISYQTLAKEYCSYHYTPELNKKFARELEERLKTQEYSEKVK